MKNEKRSRNLFYTPFLNYCCDVTAKRPSSGILNGFREYMTVYGLVCGRCGKPIRRLEGAT